MKWNFSDVSFAELIGTTAVVLSLVFVGIQVRESNREARAATIQSTLNSDLEMSAIFAENAGTWNNVILGKPLTGGEETRRGIILFNMLMTESENRYLQFKSGYLDAQSWEGRHSTLSGLANLPIYQIWRSSPGAKSHTGEFLQLLDNLVGKVSDD